MADQYFANDLEVLNYALTLEHLEAEFYDLVNASGVLSGDAAAYFKVIGEHERAHVNALTESITQAGGEPVSARSSYNFDLLGDLSTVDGILAVANVLEPTGVAAYNGAGRAIQDKAILSVAGAIVQTEANHAAIIRLLIDPNAVPAPAFEGVSHPEDIIEAITPLLGPE